MSGNFFEDDAPFKPKTGQRRSDPDLPHSPEAELGLLCCMALSESVFWEAKTAIRDGFFYSEEHRIVFSAICELRESGTVVDAITLQDRIKKLNPDAAISAVEVLEFAPDHSLWKSYWSICDNDRKKRQMYAACSQAAAHCLDRRRSGDAIRADVQKALSGLDAVTARTVMIGEAIDRRIADWDEAARTKGESGKGYPSGFATWDNAVQGIRKRTMNIIAGDAKSGKTTLALQMATNAAVLAEAKVLILSMEMSEEQLVDKMVCCHAMVSQRNLASGCVSPKEVVALTSAASMLKSKDIALWCGGSLTPQRLKDEIVRHRAVNGLDILVVDYVQLMEGDDPRKNREQHVSDAARIIKRLAMEHNFAALVLSQLTDEGKLRESRSLKMHADSVTKILVGAEDEDRHRLKIEYNRDGECAEIPCVFHREMGRFDEKPEPNETTT